MTYAHEREQDEFSILNSKQAVGLHGWALVYSINSRSTFEMISIIRDKILNYLGFETVPMVLIANKSDLEAQRSVLPSRTSSRLSADV